MVSVHLAYQDRGLQRYPRELIIPRKKRRTYESGLQPPEIFTAEDLYQLTESIINHGNFQNRPKPPFRRLPTLDARSFRACHVGCFFFFFFPSQSTQQGLGLNCQVGEHMANAITPGSRASSAKAQIQC